MGKYSDIFHGPAVAWSWQGSPASWNFGMANFNRKKREITGILNGRNPHNPNSAFPGNWDCGPTPSSQFSGTISGFSFGMTQENPSLETLLQVFDSTRKSGIQAAPGATSRGKRDGIWLEIPEGFWFQLSKT